MIYSILVFTMCVPTMDVMQQHAYSCVPWTATSTAFEVPTNFTFTDIATIKPGENIRPVENPEEAPANCEVCRQSSPDLEAQCRKSLGC